MISGNPGPVELPKAYNPKDVEDAIYKKWEDSGYFNPDKLQESKKTRKQKSKSHFSIVMPPPNVTGVLHVGHAVMLALEDIMTRFHRMRGDDTVWIPGTDHAAIATQTKVEKLLKEKGLARGSTAEGQSRHSLGREKFLAEVKKFAESSKETIHRQIRKMGSSCDWSREAYTLDEPRSLAVRTMFKKMYDDGLIYRGERIVNWCPVCASTLADDEVEYKEENGQLYYIIYKISSRESLVVATTRPETKLGDTALAVNPKDERYKKYIGKEFDVDLAGHKIHIRVIGERGVDPKFGTGVVGVTPAHSMIDWQMAEKNTLRVVKVIGQDGKMTVRAEKYAGMKVEEARAKFVADLKAAGLIEKIDDIKHNVGICYRSETIVEQLPSKQWFVNVNSKFKIQNSKIKGIKSGAKVSLKELALAAVKNGQIKILPERFEKTYFHWMNDLRDWCISRQIWFGHQVPVWYCQDCSKKHRSIEAKKQLNNLTIEQSGVIVAIEAPKECPVCKSRNIVQDADTLDTWFSSGLWTFSTLGWPQNQENKKTRKQENNDLERFHPTSVLETGYDILFFWIARMILMTTYALGEIPFETVYLHGLVRDEQGRKMSKSLGNVLDPLVVSDKYGTDAVRLSLVLGTSPGNDVKLSEEKIAGFRNFTNKLWNIGRFVLNQTTDYRLQTTAKTLADKWILSRLNGLIIEVTDDLENFRFSEAGEKLREFTWGDFADWYLEINKIQPNNSLLSDVNCQLLKLWHPFMPYVTEELWGLSGHKDFLMIAEWPKADKKLIDKKAEKEFEILRETIVKMRNVRAENKIPPTEIVEFNLYSKNIKLLEENIDILEKLSRGKIKTGKDKSAMVQIKMSAGAVNQEKEKTRLGDEKENLKKYLSGLKSKLANSDFVTRAPKAVVDGEKKKLAEAEEKLQKINEQIKSLA